MAEQRDDRLNLPEKLGELVACQHIVLAATILKKDQVWKKLTSNQLSVRCEGIRN